MTDLRQAAQQALEVLEGWDNHDKWVWPESALEQAKRNTKEAIPALRAALAEPEQEPVAELREDMKGGGYVHWLSDQVFAAGTMLYTAPTPQPEQIGNARCPRCWEPITTPTPRKPLTDEEIVRLMVGEDRVQLLYAKPGDPYFSEFAEGAIRELVESGRAIERAHGIGEQHGS